MKSIKQWWLALSKHERTISLIGSSLLVILAVYIFGWKPLANSTEILAHKVNQQEQLYIWIQQKQADIDQLLLLQPPERQSNESLFTIIEQSLKDNNLYTVANQITANDQNSISIQFERINFDEFIHWITVLEQQHAITVTQTTIDRIADTAGEVRVTVSLVRI